MFLSIVRLSGQECAKMPLMGLSAKADLELVGSSDIWQHIHF